MKLFTLCTTLLLINCVFGQASFNGNVRDMNSKNAMNNVKLMVVEENDTTYFIPDEKGNFNFKTKPGRVKIFAISDGYISELNSMNAGDGSTNRVDISMVKEELIEDLEKGETLKSSKSSAPDFSGSDRSSAAKPAYSAPPPPLLDEIVIDSRIERKGIYDSSDELITSSSNRKPMGGVLTSGEVNDFAKWELWNDLHKNEFKTHSGAWKIKLMERFCIQLSLPNGMPVIDAEVELTDQAGTTIWSARTDNTGKAELWDIYTELENKKKYSLKVTSASYSETFRNVHSFSKGINAYKIDVPCTVSDQLDIAFVVDATGSMGDEINYLKMDLDSVISLISDENKNINLRMASVFYRDFGDAYVTVESPFSSNTQLVKSFIRSNVAGGGGDFPEAADEALLAALTKLNWSSSSRARILFWVLDAPPHQEQANLDKIQEIIKLAAKMGVRIVPVGCSGITKSTEFLCRSIALATNGTYTFLTNHSGVGGSHIEPSSDGYKVESFREVLVRVSRMMSITPDCGQFISQEQIDMIDTNLAVTNPYGIEDTMYVNRPYDSTNVDNEVEILAYPNPTNGILNIKHLNDITEIFVADVNNKLLERFELHAERIDVCDIGKYTNGVYFLRYYNGQRWNTIKVVLQH